MTRFAQAKPPKPVCRVEYRDNVTTWQGSNSGEPRSAPPEIWFRVYADKAVAFRQILVQRGYKRITLHPETHLLRIPASETTKIDEEIAFLRPLTRFRFSAGAGLRHGNEDERAKAAVEQEELDVRSAQWEQQQKREHMLRAAHCEAVQVAQALFESHFSPDYQNQRQQWSERFHRLNETLGACTVPFLRKVLRAATERGGWSLMKSDELMKAADAIVTGPDSAEKRRLLAACGRI